MVTVLNLVMESGSNCNIYDTEFCTGSCSISIVLYSESAETFWKHYQKLGNVCSGEADPIWSYCSHNIGWICVRLEVDSVVPLFSNREEIAITKGKWWNVSHYNYEECNRLQDSHCLFRYCSFWQHIFRAAVQVWFDLQNWYSICHIPYWRVWAHNYLIWYLHLMRPLMSTTSITCLPLWIMIRISDVYGGDLIWAQMPCDTPNFMFLRSVWRCLVYHELLFPIDA